MSQAVVSLEQDDTSPVALPTQSDRAGLLRLLLTPVLLAFAVLALWLWMQNLDLSARAASTLEWPKVLELIQEHTLLTLLSTFLVLIIAIPTGIGLTRPWGRRFAGPVLTLANAGQATPAYGLLVVALALGNVFMGNDVTGQPRDNFINQWFGEPLGKGTVAAVFALTIVAVLPVLRNTMVGLDQVNREVLEAGKGMGLTNRQVLTQLEFPLALPVILAGVRTALVINVGTAALAFLIGGGGLGELISIGLKGSLDEVTFVAAVMTAILALLVDWVGSVAERLFRPKGL